MDVFTDPVRDKPKDRKQNVDQENDFRVTQHDPHGWWKIQREREQVPEALSGWYTKPEYAERAIANHLKKD